MLQHGTHPEIGYVIFWNVRATYSRHPTRTAYLQKPKMDFVNIATANVYFMPLALLTQVLLTFGIIWVIIRLGFLHTSPPPSSVTDSASPPVPVPAPAPAPSRNTSLRRLKESSIVAAAEVPRPIIKLAPNSKVTMKVMSAGHEVLVISSPSDNTHTLHWWMSQLIAHNSQHHALRFFYDTTNPFVKKEEDCDLGMLLHKCLQRRIGGTSSYPSKEELLFILTVMKLTEDRGFPLADDHYKQRIGIMTTLQAVYKMAESEIETWFMDQLIAANVFS